MDFVPFSGVPLSDEEEGDGEDFDPDARNGEEEDPEPGPSPGAGPIAPNGAQLPAQAAVEPANLRPHGLVWTPDQHNPIDLAAGDCRFVSPRVKWPGGIARTDVKTPYQYFRASFPSPVLPQMVTATNSNIAVEMANAKRTTTGEVIKYLGLRLAMVSDHISVDEAFSVQQIDPTSIRRPANYCLMSKGRFKLLSQCLSFKGPAVEGKNG